MDPQLCPRVREVTPKMNSLVARNIVVDKIRDVERYVERLWRNSKDSLPEDLKFQGLRRCTAKSNSVTSVPAGQISRVPRWYST